MKISKIKKTANGKYNLFFENKEKLTTYDEVILENNLLYNKEIDNELLHKLNIDTKHYDIYNKVIKFITIRLRSEKEIIDYLVKNNVEELEQKEIIQKLKLAGLINDVNFTKAYINDKINLSSDGPIKIKNSLLNYNISEETIANELNRIDRAIYLEKIQKIISKKLKLNKKYSSFMLKQKLMGDLINLGFYRDDINNCLENLSIDNNSLIDNYYDKLYKKLSLKYEGNTLYQKIKEKLYQKGFSLSEINDIINKKIG